MFSQHAATRRGVEEDGVNFDLRVFGDEDALTVSSRDILPKRVVAGETITIPLTKGRRLRIFIDEGCSSMTGLHRWGQRTARCLDCGRRP